MANPTPGSSGLSDTSMPTGASGLMPRRTSYASVVSGGASSLSQQYQPTRSGAFAYLLNNPELDQDASSFNPTGQSRYEAQNPGADLRNMGFNTNGNGHGRSGSGGRGGQLPSWSSAFTSVVYGYGYGGLGGGHEAFLIPSYLKDSKYVQKLEEAYKTKISGRKDTALVHPSQAGSLSTSASSTSLHTKVPPSHRGITHDVIEKVPPLEDEALSPLPSKWNSQDKYGALEVSSEGLEVKFTGTKSPTDRDHEAYSIRADHFMPQQCGIYYFEVTIMSRRREESSICIGFSAKRVELSRPPGWEPESWAYHGDDGNSFCCQTSGKAYGPSFTTGDTIGCGVNFRTGSAFFTKNGDQLGTAFREIKGKLFPSVGMKKSGEHIRVNFGQTPFVFDIDGLMLDEKRKIRTQIEAASITHLSPKWNETELLQKLVLQFLQHDGYVDTARAFAQEVREEKNALNLDPNAVIDEVDIKEDEDAGHRQRIRAAILDGEVERALKHTNAYYPNVLKDNEHVYFRLRCLKFIEMTRQGAELHKSNAFMTYNGLRRTYGDSDYEEHVGQRMELDDQGQSSNWDRMDTEESSVHGADYKKLVEETILYGQDLAAEFKDDPRREIRKALDDIFSLMAYQDPFNSKEVSHLLDPSCRLDVAEELNSAILLSLGKSSTAALEQLIQQTRVLLEDLREGGGSGAFVNIDDYVNPDKSSNKS